jgi:hypothetical protein
MGLRFVMVVDSHAIGGVQKGHKYGAINSYLDKERL